MKWGLSLRAWHGKQLLLLLLPLPWSRDGQGNLQRPGQGTERLGSALQRRRVGK